MPITCACPSCSRQLRVADAAAGKRAKCPQCGTVFEVPSQPREQAPSSAPPGATRGGAAAPARRGLDKATVAAIIGGVVVVVGIAAFIVVRQMGGQGSSGTPTAARSGGPRTGGPTTPGPTSPKTPTTPRPDAPDQPGPTTPRPGPGPKPPRDPRKPDTPPDAVKSRVTIKTAPVSVPIAFMPASDLRAGSPLEALIQGMQGGPKNRPTADTIAAIEKRIPVTEWKTGPISVELTEGLYIAIADRTARPQGLEGVKAPSRQRPATPETLRQHAPDGAKVTGVVYARSVRGGVGGASIVAVDGDDVKMAWVLQVFEVGSKGRPMTVALSVSSGQFGVPVESYTAGAKYQGVSGDGPGPGDPSPPGPGPGPRPKPEEPDTAYKGPCRVTVRTTPANAPVAVIPFDQLRAGTPFEALSTVLQGGKYNRPIKDTVELLEKRIPLPAFAPPTEPLSLKPGRHVIVVNRLAVEAGLDALGAERPAGEPDTWVARQQIKSRRVLVGVVVARRLDDEGAVCSLVAKAGGKLRRALVYHAFEIKSGTREMTVDVSADADAFGFPAPTQTPKRAYVAGATR